MRLQFTSSLKECWFGRIVGAIAEKKLLFRECWGRQTNSLVIGTECRPDWQLCIDAQLFTSIGVMFLLLLLFPPLKEILSLVAGLLNQAWVYAIGSALSFGWLLAAGFPFSA